MTFSLQLIQFAHLNPGRYYDKGLNPLYIHRLYQNKIQIELFFFLKHQTSEFDTHKVFRTKSCFGNHLLNSLFLIYLTTQQGCQKIAFDLPIFLILVLSL